MPVAEKSMNKWSTIKMTIVVIYMIASNLLIQETLIYLYYYLDNTQKQQIQVICVIPLNQLRMTYQSYDELTSSKQN